MHPITLVISPGRSGTKFLYNSVKANFGDGVSVGHEQLFGADTKPAYWHRSYDKNLQEEILNHPPVKTLIGQWRETSCDMPVMDFGWTMSCLAPAFYRVFGDQLQIIHLHRHPVASTASHTIMGNYSRYQYRGWAITPYHPTARFKHYDGIWESLSPFEKGMFRWLEVTAYGFEIQEQYPALRSLTIKSDQLFQDSSLLTNIINYLGLPTEKLTTIPRERNQIMQFFLETNPIGPEWKRYDSFPELNQLAANLGYDMTEDNVRKLVRKYQLPKGISPWLRYKTRYWWIRASIGSALRKYGLRPPARNHLGV